MAIKFNRSQTFATNGTVTAAGLHNLIDGTDIYQALITDQTAMTSVGSLDKLLIADSDLTAADAPRSVTVNELFEDALTLSTYTNVQATNSLYTNATGNYTRSTGATITNGTIANAVIPTLTAGTTTSTAATITSGTIPTLTTGTTTSTAEIVTRGTIATLNSTTGTIATLNSTTGTIATLNSTTGTITNLSTTLAGDFTISNGTGTLATSGATAGTYGSVTAIPFITVDAKGRITSATTGTFSSTPADGSITPAKLNGAQSGSAPIYGVRAWVSFDGTKNSSGANDASNTNRFIRGSGNVSSVLKTSTGKYTVTFATAMEDANYSVTASVRQDGDANESAFASNIAYSGTYSSSAVSVSYGYYVNSQVYADPNFFNVMVVR